jgi:hypothetical protein
MQNTLATKLIDFYKTLQPPALPADIQWLFPQKDPMVMELVEIFLVKYFSDTNRRKLLVGINPGRFGAGITGINFTGPRQLLQNCGIDHPFGNSSELSAEFIYEMIERFGGPERFYSKWFIYSVSPLGFTRNGINMNYYDDKELQTILKPFVLHNLHKILSFGFETDTCLCIGGEKNFKYLSALNKEYSLFEKIIPLPHPRFILQYRRKQKESFIQQYLDALNN